MKFTLTKEEKRFLGRWVLASGVAWLVGIILAVVLSYTIVNLFYPRETNLIVGLCVGGAVGLAQWKVLRKWRRMSSWWIYASAIGTGIPFIAEVLFTEFGSAGITLPGIEILDQVIILFTGGLITGLLQRHLLKTGGANGFLWVFVCAASWGVGWFGLFFGGAIQGLISGLFLLRWPDFFPASQIESQITAHG